MKIAFWSNSPGKAGVTGNLSCISILSAMSEPSRMVLFENHASMNNLGSTFLNQNSYDVLHEKQSYFVENGLGRVLSFCDIEQERISADMIYRTCLSVYDQRVLYLPTGGINQDLLEYRLRRQTGSVLDLLEHYVGNVIVDVSSGNLESSRKILQEADLVVVNLCQNFQLLSHFFRNFSDIQKKAFYVIGNYCEESVITKSTIAQSYHLPGSRVGTIPHNPRFADALTRGKVVSFLLRNQNCTRDNVNYPFMQAAKETVALLHQAMKQVTYG